MMKKIIDRLQQLNPWHFVWISILSSEAITLVLSTAQGRLWWEGVSRETLIIGAVDSLVVPLIVATVVVYFVKHITELQKNNERLREANRKLQDLDRMKTDFLSVVSHELRTPLTTIKALAELMSMKPAMPEQRNEKLVATINVETDRLIRLIADLLDLSRIENGTLAWRRDDVCLEEVVMNSVSGMTPLFENKALRLFTDLGPQRCTVCGDRDRLIQVMTNILSNAVKFTPRGGLVRVACRRLSPSKDVVVEISDSGPGIAAEHLEKIFEKFHRTDDPYTRTIEGTGLGLAIARQIVEYHGGKMWAASGPGGGSTFSFRLPVREEKEAGLQPVEISDRVCAGGEPLQKQEPSPLSF